MEEKEAEEREDENEEEEQEKATSWRMRRFYHDNFNVHGMLAE